MTAGSAEYVSFLGLWRRSAPCCAGEGVEGDAGSSVRLENPASPSLARQDGSERCRAVGHGVQATMFYSQHCLSAQRCTCMLPLIRMYSQVYMLGCRMSASSSTPEYGPEV